MRGGGLHYTVARTFGEPGGDAGSRWRGSWSFCVGSGRRWRICGWGVSVMPGTREAGLALEEGLIADESELISPTFYVAEGVRDWIVPYLREQAAGNPRWNLW